MKITSKGQVTIPQKFRARHGLLPNTEVEFIEEGKNLTLVKSKKSSGEGWKLVEKMSGTATTKMTTAKIMKLMRG